MLNYLKLATWGILLVAAGTLLLRPAKQRESIPPGRVEIHYWEKWTGREADQMKQIVDEFNGTVGAGKNVWVTYVSMSSVDQKTLTATAAGAPPDVAGLWDTQAAQFAAMGALEPLDEMARARGMTRDYYKPVYYDAYCYEGRLYALPSTPMAVALHYNKKVLWEKGDRLRAAGLDPGRPPQTIDELDRYAAVLDTWDDKGNLVSAGYLPQEPGWWITLAPFWFGAQIYDPATRQVNLTDPQCIAAFKWIAGYTKRLGVDTMRQFRASYPQGFDSPQSPFFTGTVVMEQEGTWKANYIAKLNPAMDNWHNLPPDQLAKLTRKERRDNCAWGAAPFPSAVPGMNNVAYCGSDILVIPATSRHKKEAFEFIAFVNRQDIMERLVSMHCKNSPLAQMSPQYIQNHPNPYIEVFEELASSPNARGLPPIPVWPAISQELNRVAERVYLNQATPEVALRDAQVRAQLEVDRFFERQSLRKNDKATW